MKKGLSIILVLVLIFLMIVWFGHDDYTEVYQADYVSSEACGSCHFINYQAWKQSPHHNITHSPNKDTVVGDFDGGAFFLPKENQHSNNDRLAAVKTYKKEGSYYMALRDIGAETYTPFKIDKVIGYQYRQTYLTQEKGGVLRRLPVQWSVPRAEFFAYWNEQEKSAHSMTDLWVQMRPLNSAWNLYCARCHTTHLQEKSKDAAHTQADVEWTEDGVGCEVCHGPGSEHVNYMQNKPLNRLQSFINLTVFDKPAPYIINAANHTKGVALSVCARCHGADILRSRMDLYRTYEPGFNEQGELNDLSTYFTEAPLEPGRTLPTVEIWPDGRPKGLGTMFRSFADSRHYELTDMRCNDCHNPHNNKLPRSAGLLQPTAQSNQFCLECHEEIKMDIKAHTHHAPGQQGSFCYDCHLPKNILNQVSGVNHLVRSHNMGSIPNPLLSIRYGLEHSPNACNECHSNQSPQWAADHLKEWQLDGHLLDVDLHLNRSKNSDFSHTQTDLN